jgi:hypothetical protein
MTAAGQTGDGHCACSSKDLATGKTTNDHSVLLNDNISSDKRPGWDLNTQAMQNQRAANEKFAKSTSRIGALCYSAGGQAPCCWTRRAKVKKPQQKVT